MDQNKQTENSGWDFQTGSDKPASDRDQGPRREGTDRHLIHAFSSWFQEHQRLLLGACSFVLVFSVLLVFASGQSNRPKYDVPGGDIELIDERKFTEWIQVTERLSERRDSLDGAINPGGSMFTFFAALGERSDLRNAVSEICEDELISLEEYRTLTHEIALTSPLENLEGYRNREQQVGEDTGSSNTPDTKQARIEQNLDLISQHDDRFKRVWNDLNEGSDRPGNG